MTNIQAEGTIIIQNTDRGNMHQPFDESKQVMRPYNAIKNDTVRFTGFKCTHGVIYTLLNNFKLGRQFNQKTMCWPGD